MLLKIEIDFNDFLGNPVGACRVLKCHKREGDPVECGDVLFDLELNAVRTPPYLDKADFEVRWMNADDVAALVVRQMRAKEPQRAAGNAEDGAAEPEDSTSMAVAGHVQLFSRDTGILREVYAEEGGSRKHGEPLALLSTDPADDVQREIEGPPLKLHHFAWGLGRLPWTLRCAGGLRL